MKKKKNQNTYSYMHTLYIPLGFVVYAVRGKGVPSWMRVSFKRFFLVILIWKPEQEARILRKIQSIYVNKHLNQRISLRGRWHTRMNCMRFFLL